MKKAIISLIIGLVLATSSVLAGWTAINTPSSNFSTGTGDETYVRMFDGYWGTDSEYTNYVGAYIVLNYTRLPHDMNITYFEFHDYNTYTTVYNWSNITLPTACNINPDTYTFEHYVNQSVRFRCDNDSITLLNESSYSFVTLRQNAHSVFETRIWSYLWEVNVTTQLNGTEYVYCNITYLDEGDRANTGIINYTWYLNGLQQTENMSNLRITDLENYTTIICQPILQDNYLGILYYNSSSINVSFDRVVTFYDEETGELIENATIDFISNAYSTNFSTNNGTLVVPTIPGGLYTLRYSSPQGYSQRITYLNIFNRTNLNISLYLLKNTSTTEVTVTVYDETSNLVEGAYVKLARYDLATNTYTVRETGLTNFEGITQLHPVLNTEFYRFYVEYPLGTVVKETNPDYIYETSLTIQINLGTGLSTDFYNSRDVSYSLVYNNATNNFRFTYLDNNAAVVEGCMEVEITKGIYHSIYNTSCLSGSSGTILLYAPNASGYTYTANTYVRFSSEYQFLRDLSVSWPDAIKTNKSGIVWVIIFTLTAILIFKWSKSIALIVLPIPTLIGSILRTIDVSLPLITGIWLLCIGFAIWLERGGYR